MRPLEGIRVLDFTWVLSGPFATRLLADYGAEVIKIQSLVTAKTADANNHPYTCAWNRSKRSVCLDMNCPEAKKLFFDLVKISDVVIDNFSPHVMKRWGIDYDTLREVNPGIIQCQISAAGHRGPDQYLSGFGPGIQAMTGLTAATSYSPDEPLGIGFAYADHVMGLYASAEILRAIFDRMVTGKGAYIDISGMEAAASVTDDKIPEYAYVKYCEDGKWCAVSPENEEQLCESKQAACSDAHHMAEALQQKGIAAHEVSDSRDLFSDSHLKERNCFETIPHKVLGKMLFDRTPIRMVPDELCAAKESPQLGEANEYVFRELLGLEEAVYWNYVQNGIIF